MKNVKTITSTTIIAGALCATLLAGCGNATTSMETAAHQSASAASAETTTSTIASTDVQDANSSEYLASASDYPNISSFTAKTLDGKTFTQDDLSKADVTLINFWSPYCGYCVEEMPQIAAWAKTLPANVQVITVCTDYESDPVSAKEILQESGFKGTTLVSGTGDISKLVGEVEFLPTTIVVDSSGNVVGHALEGIAEDVPATFGQMVNEALQAQGKAAIDA